MSTNDELWDQLSLRVARSQLGGVTAEDDDVLAAADLLEALINPNRGGQSGGGAGMPGMMPPMMMGGAGMGGAGMGAGAGGAARPAEASMGPMAVPNPATTAAGVPGEARMKEQPPPSVGGGGGPISSGGSRIGSGGGIGGGGVGEVSGLGGGARGLSDEADTAVEDDPPEETPEPDSEVGGVAMVSAPPDDKPIDGFAVDPVQVRALGDRWAELGASVSALPHHPEADMGLFERAQRPHQALSQQINSWREGAAEEFEAIAARLHATAAQYEGADDEGVRAIRQTEGLNP